MSDKEKEMETPISVDAGSIKMIKEAGFVPEGIKKASLEQVADLSKNKYETIAYLAAKGMDNSEIAEAVGLSVERTKVILSSERVQFEIKAVRYKLFGKDAQKRHKEILPAAIDIQEEIMLDPKMKPAVRLHAAINFQDRVLGKPKQTIEHEGNLIRELFDRLDGKKKQDTIDIEAKEVIASDIILEDNPEKDLIQESPKDSVDKWVDENL